MIATMYFYERFNGNDFEQLDNVTVVTLLDLLHISQRPHVEPEHTLFCDMGFFDIFNTVKRGLEQVALAHDHPWARVYHSPKVLQQLAIADTGVGLIAEGSISPFSNVGPDWSRRFIPQALGAGCIGAIIDEIHPEVYEQYPDAVYLRRVPNK